MLETAIEAAALVQATYATEPISVTLDAPGAETINQADTPLEKRFPEIIAGDADRAFAAAAVKIDCALHHGAQHHNPIELIATVAEWKDGKLIVHESTQNAEGLRHGLVAALGLTPDRVEVISPYVGGGFGQKYAMQMQTVLVAVAARRLGRAVKLVVPRAQIFHDSSFRPAIRHRVRLGADRSGKMVAAIHEVDAQTSRHDLFPAQYAAVSSRLYGIKNFRGRERFVRTDVQTPGYMRAPFEHAACFALECCVDELAYSLGRDPVALRLANDTATDAISKLPLSSRHVGECLRRGAERFGWSKRIMTPQSMRADDGSCIGWGVAIGAYPCFIVPAVARLRVTVEGGVFISIGTHEMGQGIRTALAAAVGRKLGVPAVNCRGGNRRHTRCSPAYDRRILGHGLGHSGCHRCRRRNARGSGETKLGRRCRSNTSANLEGRWARFPRSGSPDESVRDNLMMSTARSLQVSSRLRVPSIPNSSLSATARTSWKSVSSQLHGVYEYRAWSAWWTVGGLSARVPRRARCRGGVVWGIGAALREASEVDPRYGGFLNADLAEYLVPVNADIGCIEVEFIDEPDFKFNSAGVKGLGEVSMVGVAPAIANAVFHATGRRVRNLPIRIEDLL